MESLEKAPRKQLQSQVEYPTQAEFYQQHGVEVFDDEIDLLEIFKFFWDYKKIIMLFSILSTVLTVALIFLKPIPKVIEYEATTKFVRIAEGRSSSVNLSGLSGIASLMGVGSPVSAGSGSKIEFIVKSQSFFESIIEKLDLLPLIYGEYYDPSRKRLVERELTILQKFIKGIKAMVMPDPDETEETLLSQLYPPVEYNSYPYVLKSASTTLMKQMEFEQDKGNGLYSVTVKWINPVLAATIANRIVIELIAELEKNQFSSNQREQSFLNDQLAVANKNFKQSEEDLRIFLEKYGFSMDQHAKILATSIGSIKSNIESEEIQLKIAKEFQGDENASVSLSKMKIRVLKERLSELEAGTADRDKGKKFKSFTVSLKDIPALSIEYQHLTGELNIHLEIVKMLRMQSEKLQIEKAKEVERIRVIDRAVPPQYPVKTRHLLYVIMGMFLGIVIGTSIAYILYLKRKRGESEKNTDG
jgi:uncharacterized protein involved in exopolysaccharide biosynthesis